MIRRARGQRGARLSIRDVTTADLAAVLLINEASVPAMNSLSLARLRWFASEAEYFRVASFGSAVAGFLICLAPDAPYDSPNFRWFNERYRDFLYVDRIAVSVDSQRRGVARALYEDAAARVGDRFRMLAAEVNVRPRNEGSLRFHGRFGFEPVGSQDRG